VFRLATLLELADQGFHGGIAGDNWRFPLTAAHGQTSGNPPAKPGDCLIYLIANH